MCQCNTSNKIKLGIKKLTPDAKIPIYAADGSAGFDIYTTENTVVKPHATNLLSTGIAMEIPRGYEVQIRMRSGIALKTPLRMSNGIGTIDFGYTGEVKIMLENTSDKDFFVEAGTRIAQGIVNKLPEVELIEIEELSDSERGEGGFNSTGLF